MKKSIIHYKCLRYLIIISLLILGVIAPSFAQKKSSPKDSTTSVTITDSTSSKNKKSSQDITDTIHYESDKIDYNSEDKILTLIGKSSIHYQDITLNADTIIYNINNNVFSAAGLPKLIEGKDTTIGDIMVYNIKTRRGKVRYASTHFDDGYFNGQQIVKTDKDELYVNEGDYTTCAVVDTPHFFFYGKNIKVIPKDKIVARPVVFNIGNAPVAVLPYFIFPIEHNRRSGLLTPSWGGHPNSGGYIDNIGGYYAPNDYIDFLVRGKVMEFREFMLEASSRYAIKYLLNGSISARTTINSDFRNNKQQWAIDYNHFQNITPDGLTTLSGGGTLLSDKNFFNKYSEDTTELINQNLTATMSLAHRFEKINASATINYSRSHNLKTDDISEDLPSINFSLPSRPFIPAKTDAKDDDIKWYNKIYYDYSANGKIKHIKTDTNTYQPGLYQGVNISSPQKLFKYITLEPHFSARLSTFNSAIDTVLKGYDTIHDTINYTVPSLDKDKYANSSEYKVIHQDTTHFDYNGIPDSISIKRERTRTVAIHHTNHDTLCFPYGWNAGVNLSTNLYGIFPIHILNFAGIRHTFTPTLSYSFVPKINLDKTFDDIGIDYERGHAQSQVLGISVHNLFEGKILKKSKGDDKPEETKFPILDATLSTGYDTKAITRKLQDLSLTASTSFKILNVHYTSSFWFYDNNNQLSLPSMSNMTLDLSTNALSAHGTFWGGDMLELDSLQKYRDPQKFTNGGAQKWDFSLSPSFSYSLSRLNPTEMFVPVKNYSLNASASINFTPNWSMSWAANYNFKSNEWVQNSINIHCDLECWNMQFQWRPEKLNPGYYFLLNIKKIPEIKWEQHK